MKYHRPDPIDFLREEYPVGIHIINFGFRAEVIGYHKLAKMLIVRSTEFEGRLRKYYHITPLGLQRIEDFKTEWQELMAVYNYIVEEDYE